MAFGPDRNKKTRGYLQNYWVESREPWLEDKHDTWERYLKEKIGENGEYSQIPGLKKKKNEWGRKIL